MNTLVTIAVVALASFATILGVIYLDKMTKKPKDVLPVENPEVEKPTLPKKVYVKPLSTEVLEPLKEVIAPSPKPKSKYKYNKNKNTKKA